MTRCGCKGFSSIICELSLLQIYKTLFWLRYISDDSVLLQLRHTGRFEWFSNFLFEPLKLYSFVKLTILRTSSNGHIRFFNNTCTNQVNTLVNDYIFWMFDFQHNHFGFPGPFLYELQQVVVFSTTPWIPFLRYDAT